MKYILTLSAILVVSLLLLTACNSSGSAEPRLYGPPIPENAQYLEISELVKNAKKYAEKDVYIQGKATNQCPSSGCWIDVVGLGDESGTTVTVHMRGPAFDDRLEEIKGKLVGKKVKVKGYVSVQGEQPEVYATSLVIIE